MTARISIGVVMAIVLATLTTAMSAAAAGALIFPGSALASAMNLSIAHEARAGALLGGRPSQAAIAEAVSETRSSLRTSVANPSAWLRLAYIDTLRSGTLTDEGREAIARSYTLSPYGPSETPWRLRFVLDRWTEIGSANRVRTLEEIRLTQQHRPHVIRELTGKVRSPSGRLALTLASLPDAAAPSARPSPSR